MRVLYGIASFCQVQTHEQKKWLIVSFHQVMGIHQKRKNIQELCPLRIQWWLKLDKTSNSSNCNYTQLVSVSFTNASTERKTHTCLSFYII